MLCARAADHLADPGVNNGCATAPATLTLKPPISLQYTIVRCFRLSAVPLAFNPIFVLCICVSCNDCANCLAEHAAAALTVGCSLRSFAAATKFAP